MFNRNALNAYLENIVFSSQCEFLATKDKVNWRERVNLAAINYVLKYKKKEHFEQFDNVFVIGDRRCLVTHLEICTIL